MATVAVVALLVATLIVVIQKLLFWIAKGLCWIIGFLNDLFEMIAGLQTVTYKGGGIAEPKLLIKVFFGNTTINTIYWGMALIGIVMCFGFAIFAIIKKCADDGEKIKQTMGGILRNALKGVLLILLMNFIVSATISISSTLLNRINYLMLNANNIDTSYDVTFDSEDYGCMARSLNTIGNYSLSASYNSRYNLNSCYNDIRPELEKLAEKGVFEVTYITTTYDEDGTSRTVNTWQSVLQTIYRSVDDISVDQPLDDYNEKLADALLEAMDIIKNDASFEALEIYHVDNSGSCVGEMVSLDRVVMLLGSMYGNGGTLAKGTGITDWLRGPYYYGTKDLYDYATCNKDFDMSVGTWMYLTVIVVAILFIKEMLALVFNATARIFNMLLLYISAPPIIAVTPLDDGGKLKQWTTAFIIQSFGFFGAVISIRLLTMFIPMLFSGDIQFFEGARTDYIAKLAVTLGAIFTCSKASGMIVGILADNAGMQAISAGDVGNEARGLVDKGVSLAKSAGSMAWGAVKNDWAAGNWIYDKASKSGGGGSSEGDKKENNEGSEKKPDNTLEQGSKTSSTPSNNSEQQESSEQQNNSEQQESSEQQNNTEQKEIPDSMADV